MVRGQKNHLKTWEHILELCSKGIAQGNTPILILINSFKKKKITQLQMLLFYKGEEK